MDRLLRKNKNTFLSIRGKIDRELSERKQQMKLEKRMKHVIGGLFRKTLHGLRTQRGKARAKSLPIGKIRIQRQLIIIRA
jgi:hypothetical protein